MTSYFGVEWVNLDHALRLCAQLTAAIPTYRDGQEFYNLGGQTNPWHPDILNYDRDTFAHILAHERVEYYQDENDRRRARYYLPRDKANELVELYQATYRKKLAVKADEDAGLNVLDIMELTNTRRAGDMLYWMGKAMDALDLKFRGRCTGPQTFVLLPDEADRVLDWLSIKSRNTPYSGRKFPRQSHKELEAEARQPKPRTAPKAVTQPRRTRTAAKVTAKPLKRVLDMRGTKVVDPAPRMLHKHVEDMFGRPPVKGDEQIVVTEWQIATYEYSGSTWRETGGKSVPEGAKITVRKNSVTWTPPKAPKTTAPKRKKRWTPKWDKPQYEKFLTMQNVPEDWAVERIVAIWRGTARQDLRILTSTHATATAIMSAIMDKMGWSGSDILPFLNSWKSKRISVFNFKLNRAQYDTLTDSARRGR